MRYIRQQKRLMTPAEIKLIYQAECVNAKKRTKSDAEYFRRWNRQIWPAYHILQECVEVKQSSSPFKSDAQAILRVHADAQSRFEDLMSDPQIVHAYNLRYQHHHDRFEYLRRIRLLLGLSV